MPVIEIIEGVLASLVYDGLKRPTKGIADAVNRRKNISKALSAEQAEEKARTGSVFVGDLIKVIAHGFGEYDIKIAEFLRDVERSALPDALRQFIVCGKDVQQIYPAFELIYKSHAPLGFECSNLFNALVAAIKQRLMQSVGDKGTFEVITAQHQDLVTRLDALGATLQKASRSAQVISYGNFSEARLRICRNIESANKYIPVETTNGMKRVPIAKMVIGARLSSIDTRNKVLLAHRDVNELSESTLSFINFRRNFNRAVIMGDPGGGKSTLTQHLCYVFASQIMMEDNNRFDSKFHSEDLKVPLRVIVRSLERKQKRNPSYSIFDYLIDEHRVALDNNANYAVLFMSQLLTVGGAVVLFDGLDEILDIELRRGMTIQIEQFASSYATCPIVVTSRIVGYLDAPMSDDFLPYTLSRFNKEEIEKFSEQLLKNVLNLKVKEAKTKAAEFLEQTEMLAADLRQNPLLLGLMVYIFAIKGSIPNNRPEIYKECSLLMFEKWDQRRDIIVELPTDIDLLDLFSFLAKQIFGNAETEDGVSEDWLLHQLRDYFFGWYGNKPKSIEMAKKFVSFVTGRAWVMCDVGPKLFKFTHRTFLEYFFARRLQEESQSVDELIGVRLFDKICSAQWDVVSHLALQISVFRSAPRSEQACDTLLNLLKSVQMKANQEVNFLSFFGKAMEYLLIPETKNLAIVRMVFQRAIELGAHHDLSSIDIVHQLIARSGQRQQAVTKEIMSIVHPIIAGVNSPQRLFVLYLSGTEWAGDTRNHFPIEEAEGQLIYRAFRDVRKSLRNEQKARASDNVVEARALVYVYNSEFPEAYKKHGAKLLLSPTTETVPFELRMLPYIAVAETARFFGARPFLMRSYFTSKSAAAEFIRDFSDQIVDGKLDTLINAQQVNLPQRMVEGLASELVITLLYLLTQENLTREVLETAIRCLYCYVKLDKASLINVDEVTKTSLRKVRQTTFLNAKARKGSHNLEARLQRSIYGSEILDWFQAVSLIEQPVL